MAWGARNAWYNLGRKCERLIVHKTQIYQHCSLRSLPVRRADYESDATGVGEIRETKTVFSVCGIDLGRRDFMGGGCGLELLRFYGDLEILFLVLLLAAIPFR